MGNIGKYLKGLQISGVPWKIFKNCRSLEDLEEYLKQSHFPVELWKILKEGLSHLEGIQKKFKETADSWKVLESI